MESLIFDMKDLEYISSAGLRVLIYTRQELDSNASMVLKNVQDAVKDVFEVTGLIEVFNIE